MTCNLENKKIRIYLVTWNVAHQTPPEDMTRLLDLNNSQTVDIYGIGLQELSHIYDAEKNPWTQMLTKILGRRGYVRLKLRHMIGMLTLVFVRRTHLLRYTNIESEITKAGMGGWWGNKGGVSVRFDVNGTNVIIVNSHLAAHRDNVAERIEDFLTILDTQKFRDDDTDNIYDHDYVFWIGDLNFRVDDYSRQEVEGYISKGEYSTLLRKDQLLQCVKEKKAFDDFQEGEIDFPPTYKFDKGTDTYDTSEKQRVPAWCDRILWLTHEEEMYSVEQCLYRSIAEYKESDHKPVVASFIIQIPAQPPCPLVTFLLRNKRLYIKKDNDISYHVKRRPKMKTSSWDWIGLYKCDFTNVRDYVTYVWAVPEAEKNQSGVTITFEAKQMSITPGNYHFCYISSTKDILCGMSDVIEVLP